MRYVRDLSASGAGKIDRQVVDLGDLAAILKGATYDDWLEGLGQPVCDYGLCMWRIVGKFIEEKVMKEMKNAVGTPRSSSSSTWRPASE